MNLFKYPWFQDDLIREKFAPSGGAGVGTGYTNWLQPVDQIANLKTRSEAELLKLYRDTAYYCANMNARGVARTPLLMYRKTGTGMSVGKGARRLKSTYKDRATKYVLVKDGYLGSDDDEVDEIIGHPFLELLEKPFQEDGVGMMGKFTFWEVTQLYLEIVGRAYWAMDLNDTGQPVQLFPLIADKVEPYRSPRSEKFVDLYKYQTETGIKEIPKNEVVPFHCTLMSNPYTGGYSPMQAASDRVGVNLSYMAQTQALLNNRARPDVLISPKGDAGGLGKAQAKRIALWFKQAFGGRNTGLPAVSEEAIEVTPLTFSPKDMGELKEDDMTVAQIARIFDVPLSMLNRDANRASAEEGRKQHAFDALCPRHTRLEQAINANIMPRYDKTGATFVKFDEPYKQPMVPEAKDVPALITAEVFHPDEARELFGYGPMPAEMKAELDQRRQDELNAKKPPMKPNGQPATANNAKSVNHYRRLIRDGRALNLNGHKH